MGGDYTRERFDPVKGYTGVHEQQGRVSLDSDFNEFEEILDRRNRAQTYDTIGGLRDSAARAVVPMTTKDGFKIGLDAGKQITIHPGRAYVDGILAECFFDTANDKSRTAQDSALGGLKGVDPLPFAKQPFAYSLAGKTLPDLSTPARGQVPFDLAYLDVWQREVSIFEERDHLGEPALGGADTTTRVQTAWQVKVLRDVPEDACDLSPERLRGWLELVAPSSATLSVTKDAAAATAGPCVIDPAGGYTGIENRLYRVEIQRGGKRGSATPQFKWSRDNASLAATVRAKPYAKTIAGTGTLSVIPVESYGRDAWMRFKLGDHIELLDDDVEFAMRETDVGGQMAEVTFVDEATNEIYIDKDFSAFPFGTDPKHQRHPRIRRWDHAEGVTTLAPDVRWGDKTPLEEGISITFHSTEGDRLHAGDYWVFTARTATGEVEELKKALPRGILHHFARLAVIQFGSPQPKDDCRVMWPPDEHGGCCTAVVEVGEDIQAAIDSLDKVGGCVCLRMGTHVITKPLFIRQENLTLHGEVPWVTVRLARGPEAPFGRGISVLHDGRSVRITGVAIDATNVRDVAVKLQRYAEGSWRDATAYESADTVEAAATEPSVEFTSTHRPAGIAVGERMRAMLRVRGTDAGTNTVASNEFMWNVAGHRVPTGSSARVLEVAPQSAAQPLRNVSVLGILFIVPDGYTSQPLIRVKQVTGGRIAECGLTVEDPKPEYLAKGIELNECRDYEIEDSEITGVASGIEGMTCTLIGISENSISSLRGFSEGDKRISLGLTGIRFADEKESPQGITIARNELSDFRRGIELGDVQLFTRTGVTSSRLELLRAADGCRITANTIRRLSDDPSFVAGGSRNSSTGNARFFAITAHVMRCEIVENTMTISNLTECGILASGGNTLIARNEVRSTAAAGTDMPGRIPFGVVAYTGENDTLSCTIRDNLFIGLQVAVFAQGAARGSGMHRVDVLSNRVFLTRGASAGMPDHSLLAASPAMGTSARGSGGTASTASTSSAATSTTLVTPPALLRALVGLARYPAIAVGRVQHGRVAENEIAMAICGVLLLDASGVSVAANRITETPIAVLAGRSERCDVSDNVIEGAHVAALLFMGKDCAIAGNRVSSALLGVMSLGGTATRIESNTLRGGTTGIELFDETDARVGGNDVEDMTNDGITSLVSRGDLTIAHDRVIRCGYHTTRRTAAGGSAAARTVARGITAYNVVGSLTVDSCQVLDVGEPAVPNDAPFGGIRYGILVWQAVATRIRGCRVTSPPLDGTRTRRPAINSGSRALVVRSAPIRGATPLLNRKMRLTGSQYADATDNILEQTTARLVEIAAGGELIFATNRCRNLAPAPGLPSVYLGGTRLNVTGNRVQAEGRPASLRLAFTDRLVAVGNLIHNNVEYVGGGTALPATEQNWSTLNGTTT